MCNLFCHLRSEPTVSGLKCFSLSPTPILTSLNTGIILYRTKNERYHHQRCPPAQPQKYQRHDPPRQARGNHRSLRLREIDARIRHALRRRAAAVRRIALHLRPPVSRGHAQAGR